LYQTLTIWPIEVRGDLRAAVRAKHEGDLELSQRFYNRAWTTIQTLPLSERSDSYYLKLTGLGIAFADVLEQGGKKEQAYEVYVRAWDLLQGPNITIGPVRLRAVSLASKLGDLAGELEKPLKEREKWLVWAVEEVLRVVKDEGKGELDLPMLALPSWIRKTDIGAPLEALGEFYEQVGNIEFAMPLYLHAISLLIPPAPKKSSPEDRCRAASLMTHLSSLILNSRPPAQSADDQKSTHVHQAESWAKQALAVATQARTEILHPPQRSRFFGGGGRDDSSVDAEFCDQVYAAALFNLPKIRTRRRGNLTFRESAEFAIRLSVLSYFSTIIIVFSYLSNSRSIASKLKFSKSNISIHRFLRVSPCTSKFQRGFQFAIFDING
ncbi:hypothetical protein F5880DRAFT_1490004, partial [Lentinula raphanica]